MEGPPLGTVLYSAATHGINIDTATMGMQQRTATLQLHRHRRHASTNDNMIHKTTIGDCTRFSVIYYINVLALHSVSN